jgi:hypothetical protein
MRPPSVEVPRWPLWLTFLVPAVLVGAVVMSDVSTLRELSSKSPFVEADAHVVRLDCENHGAYFVQFEVDGRLLERGPASHYFRKDCHSQVRGANVSVWYSLHDTTYATFIEPEKASAAVRNDIWAVICVAYPLFVGLFFVLTRKGEERA